MKFAGTESAIEVYRACQEAVGETALIEGRGRTANWNG